MNINQPTPFVKFPDGALKAIESHKDEFFTWTVLHTLINRNDFQEGTLEAVIQYYTPIKNVDNFLELQLKFFLIRNSQFGQRNIVDLVNNWLSAIKGSFTLNSTELTLKLISPTNHVLLNTYGRYYYSLTSFKKYVESWNNCTVDLNTWKIFKYLSMPNDFNFIKPLFKEQGGLAFPVLHIKKLFDEYVDELYVKKFESRLSNKSIAERDRVILERVMQNIGSVDDKKYLNNQFIKFYDWSTISDNISNCLVNTISISQLDIHSQLSYANYFALVKYFEVLSSKQDKKRTEKFALWFKSMPKDIDRKNEVHEELKNVFDMIQKNCPNASWNDFKSIFNKNGVNIKIEWQGDASILNFIFRKFNKVLSFEGSKWDVLNYYFYKSDKNDNTLSPEKLAGNTHYKNDQLENQLKKVIDTLG